MIRHKMGLIFAALWLGAAAVAACAGAQQGSEQATRADAAAAGDALQAAYEVEGDLIVAAGECDGFDADACPALNELRIVWRPIFAAWDVYAAAVEGGAGPEALRTAYCHVIALSPRAAGLPKADCDQAPVQP